jgi:hypothetical protein
MQICVLFKNGKNSHSRENGDLFFWIPNQVGNEEREELGMRGAVRFFWKKMDFQSSWK